MTKITNKLEKVILLIVISVLLLLSFWQPKSLPTMATINTIPTVNGSVAVDSSEYLQGVTYMVPMPINEDTHDLCEEEIIR